MPPPTGYLDIRFVQLFVLPVLFLLLPFPVSSKL
jgi:hypothetical protein